jgi:hypothetical protein
VRTSIGEEKAWKTEKQEMRQDEGVNIWSKNKGANT